MLLLQARVSRRPLKHKPTLAGRSNGRVFFLGAMPPDPHGSRCALDFNTTLITPCPCMRLHLTRARHSHILHYLLFLFTNMSRIIDTKCTNPSRLTPEYVCDDNAPHPPACPRHTVSIVTARWIIFMILRHNAQIKPDFKDNLNFGASGGMPPAAKCRLLT